MNVLEGPMETYRRAVMVVGAVGLLAVPVAARAQAAGDPCKPVFDAMLKETVTPHRTATTRNGIDLGEAISTADATYVKMKGQWLKSPEAPKQTLERQQENIRSVRSSACTALPDEVVDGKPASVWHAHYEQPDLGVSESKVWIAKATGLPIRTDVSIQAGEKTSVVTRFDYDHVTAPVVK